MVAAQGAAVEFAGIRTSDAGTLFVWTREFASGRMPARLETFFLPTGATTPVRPCD